MVREKGKFVKGHKGIGGRPPRTEEREIIAALDKAIPMGDVLAKLATAIKNGEDWAVKLYLAYHWHLPTQPVQNEITGNVTIKVRIKPDGDG